MSVDCEDIVRFQFQDHVDGYVDLDLSEPQETPHKGWTITPRKEPLRVSFFFQNLLLMPHSLQHCTAKKYI